MTYLDYLVKQKIPKSAHYVTYESRIYYYVIKISWRNSLLELNAIELYALQDHFQDEGLCEAGAEWLSRLAIHIGPYTSSVTIKQMMKYTNVKIKIQIILLHLKWYCQIK